LKTNAIRAQACYALSILFSLMIFSLTAGAVVERFSGSRLIAFSGTAGAPGDMEAVDRELARRLEGPRPEGLTRLRLERQLNALEERQAWIGTFALAVLSAASGLNVLAVGFAYRYVVRSLRERDTRLGLAAPPMGD
jgi:hypothetical protein